MTLAPPRAQPASPAAGSRWSRLPSEAVLGGGLLVLLAGSFVPAPLGAVLTLPLALLLPGHAVRLALVGTGRPQPPVVRLVADVAISVAVLAVAGLLVGLPGLVLTRGRVLGAVGLVVVASGFVAWRRPAPAAPSAGSPRPGFWTVVAGIVAAALVVLSLVLVVASAPEPTASLSLSAVDTRQGLLPHPGAGDLEVAVAVSNDTARDQTVRVGAEVAGGRAWAGQTVEVAADGEWQGELRGPVPPGGCARRLTVTLGRPGEAPVASLTRWVAGEPGQPC